MSLFEELKRRNVFRVGIAWVLMGWVVLQGADFVLDLVGAPDWVIRAMAVIGVAGLPIALFFAWAFEVTPEGIKREAEVDRSQSITPHTGRKLDRAIIVFLALAVVLLLGDRWYHSGAEHLPDQEPAEGHRSRPRNPRKSRSPFCRSPTCPRTRSRSTFPTASPRKFSTPWPAWMPSRWPGAPPPSPSRAVMKTCAPSAKPWAWSTFSRARCARPATVCASPLSWSRWKTASTSGRRPTTGS